jgi:hypothetical protein
MPNKRISELDELYDVEPDDLMPVCDVNDVAFVTKKISASTLRDTFILPVEVSDVNFLQSILDNKLSYNSVIDGGSF